MLPKRRFTFPFISLLFIAACTKPTADSSLPADISPPTLSFPLASLASTDRFTPFGAPLTGSGLNTGYSFHLLDTSESCEAACSGIISSIVSDANGGNDITVKYKSNSIYSCVYAGISNLQVHVNDSINAGAVLGTINSSGELDFYLVRSNTEALCPENFGAQAFNNSIQLAISLNNQINPSKTVSTPCLVDSLPN